MKRCSAVGFRRCERADGHMVTNDALVHRYHAAADRVWIRHGAYDLAWKRCVAVKDGSRCTNLAVHGVGASECGEREHRWAEYADVSASDSAESDAKDLCHSLGAP